MNRVIKPGIYLHFKGSYYQVLCVAKHTETEQQFVVYRGMLRDREYFVRPLEMFVSKVDRKKYPYCKQLYRFEYVGKNIPKFAAYNVSEHHPVDGFVCSRCGVRLEDWTRIEVDEVNEDLDYYDYAFEYCPKCGAKIIK